MACSQEMFDLEFSFADTRCLVPMDLSVTNAAVLQPQLSHTFTLSPVATAVQPAQAGKFSDARARSKGFDLGNLTNDAEVHSTFCVNGDADKKR
jgi:hypothetical protein